MKDLDCCLCAAVLNFKISSCNSHTIVLCCIKLQRLITEISLTDLVMVKSKLQLMIALIIDYSNNYFVIVTDFFFLTVRNFYHYFPEPQMTCTFFL